MRYLILILIPFISFSQTEVPEKYWLNDISFEEALRDLEKIVDELNNGDMELEKAITAYEKGIKLKNICEERLKNAQERIELIQNKKEIN